MATATKKRPKIVKPCRKVINVADRVHAELTLFCESQQPSWPIGYAAELAIEEFVSRKAMEAEENRRKSAAGGELVK